MKKIFTILCIAAMAITVNAAQQATIRPVKNNQVVKQLATKAPKMEPVEANAEMYNFENLFLNKAPMAEQPALADYYCADGMFHSGLDRDFYNYIPLLMFPYDSAYGATQIITFENLYGPATWMFMGKEVAKDSEKYEYEAFLDRYGLYYLPEIKAHKATLKMTTGKDTTVLVDGYIYAESEASQALSCGLGEMEDEETGEISKIPMTLCGMYTDTISEPNGNDMWMVGGLPYGKYRYGTKLLKDTLVPGEYYDTIGVLVRNSALMKIDEINIPVYQSDNAGQTHDGSKLFPDDAVIRINIFSANLSTGKIYTNDTLGSTTITKATYNNLEEDGYDWIGIMHAQFWKKNIIGRDVRTPIYAPGDFYVQITGFNESNCDFGIYCDYSTPLCQTTVFQDKGKFPYHYASAMSRRNLAMSFDAYWPTVINDTTLNTMNVELEGGATYYGEDKDDNVVMLYTNTDSYDLQANATYPDWLKLVMDDSYYEEYGAIMFQFTAEKADAARTGEVIFNADGAIYKMTIEQKQKETGLNLIKALNDNKRYNIFGTEVNKNFKGIVIKNGQTLLQ